jgi:CheY-like chemotaxis protein
VSPFAPIPPHHPSSVPLLGLRILAVEDHAVGRVLLQALLEGIGAEATLAATGEEALALAEHEDFDVVLVDLGLPDVSGEALAAALAECPGTCEAAILAVTGRGRPQALPAVFHDWLSKPYSARELYTLIARSRPRFAERA